MFAARLKTSPASARTAGSMAASARARRVTSTGQSCPAAMQASTTSPGSSEFSTPRNRCARKLAMRSAVAAASRSSFTESNPPWAAVTAFRNRDVPAAFDERLQNANRSAAQRKRVCGTSRHDVDGACSGQRVESIRDGDERARIARRRTVFSATREIVLGNDGRHGGRRTLSERVRASHFALELGQLADQEASRDRTLRRPVPVGATAVVFASRPQVGAAPQQSVRCDAPCRRRCRVSCLEHDAVEGLPAQSTSGRLSNPRRKKNLASESRARYPQSLPRCTFAGFCPPC